MNMDVDDVIIYAILIVCLIICLILGITAWRYYHDAKNDGLPQEGRVSYGYVKIPDGTLIEGNVSKFVDMDCSMMYVVIDGTKYITSWDNVVIKEEVCQTKRVR